MTAYLIPIGTYRTIAAPGNQPKPLVARRQIRFDSPPELIDDDATFNFARCRLTVPRDKVIVAHRNDSGEWKTFGV
jgi:hypothetical protein